MNDQTSLSQYAASPADLFQYEAYVMSYLKALAQQPIYGGDHPLNVQFHLLPNEAYLRLCNPAEVEQMEKLLNCKKGQVFERLRDFIDEWDGVRVPTSYEIGDLTEADSDSLLLNDEAHRFAAHFLHCAPEGVLGTLFDPKQLYTDIQAVSGGARFANNDVYRVLRSLSSLPAMKQKIKDNLFLRDWWEVLENWVRPTIQAELAATLSQQTGNPVKKAYVLRELFRLVKLSLNTETNTGKSTTRFVQSTRLGTILPEETSRFWSTLKEFSAEDANSLKLDSLTQDNLAKNSNEANAKEALRLADSYMQTYVQPIQHELGQVDMLGMVALKHRFQGIVDELLSNALHYASLDSDVQNPFSYIQDAIRYYCHGEYRIALKDLLNVPLLSLEQMGVQYQVTTRDLEVEADIPINLFSSDENSILPGLRKGSRQHRNVANDELLITLQVENHQVEIMSLNKLERRQIEHIKSAFPKTVAGLINNGQPLPERIMKTPIPVTQERQKLNAVLGEQIQFLVQALVLTGIPFSLGRLIPSTDVFNKVPKALPTDMTLVQAHTRESLGEEIVSTYKKERMSVTRINGS